jgi:hypothetical protein
LRSSYGDLLRFSFLSQLLESGEHLQSGEFHQVRGDASIEFECQIINCSRNWAECRAKHFLPLDTVGDAFVDRVQRTRSCGPMSGEQESAGIFPQAAQRFHVHRQIPLRGHDDNRGLGRDHIPREDQAVMGLVKDQVAWGMAGSPDRFKMPRTGAIRRGAKREMVPRIYLGADCQFLL